MQFNCTAMTYTAKPYVIGAQVQNRRDERRTGDSREPLTLGIELWRRRYVTTSGKFHQESKC